MAAGSFRQSAHEIVDLLPVDDGIGDVQIVVIRALKS
jgi:hypothetical protein